MTRPSSAPSESSPTRSIAAGATLGVPRSAATSAFLRSMPITRCRRPRAATRAAAPMPEPDPVTAIVLTASPARARGRPCRCTGSRGRPSARSPITLRWTWSVPPPMRLAHWLRNWSCQRGVVGGVVAPERRVRADEAITRSPVCARCCEYASLSTDASGPGIWPWLIAVRSRNPMYLMTPARMTACASCWRTTGSSLTPMRCARPMMSASCRPPLRAADHGALVAERRLRDAPAVVHVAEHVGGRDAHVGEEDLVEVRDAGDLHAAAARRCPASSCRR